MLDYIERVYNARRQHTTIGYLTLWNSSAGRGSLKPVSSKPVQVIFIRQ